MGRLSTQPLAVLLGSIFCIEYTGLKFIAVNQRQPMKFHGAPLLQGNGYRRSGFANSADGSLYFGLGARITNSQQSCVTQRGAKSLSRHTVTALPNPLARAEQVFNNATERQLQLWVSA